MTISAKIILDSINPYNGIRLITSELTYPRFIHAEFMTHRMFSRNAASSRAIPISKMMKMVQDNPAMPVHWGKNMKGMSSNSLVPDVESAKACWIAASKSAIESAVQLTNYDLHKQITNRVLEPFQYITVICTATEYSNFFRLRDHKDAQPEIAELAKIWRAAQDNSEPQERIWHIPYIQEDEKKLDLDVQKKIGVARCARVSYLTHDGVRSIDKDLELYERLLTGSDHGHWSPFEHVAMATDWVEDYFDFSKDEWVRGPIWCGNFRGWIQYRKLHSGENN